MRLAIFGTGGMGRELFDIAVSTYDTPIVFVTVQPDGPCLGIPVIGPDELGPEDRIIFAVGNSAARRALARRFSDQPLATVIANTAVISGSARIGEGSVICEYAVVNNSAVIGKHYQGNVFSQVSHDCIIGDYVTVSPRASINGWVEIGDEAFIGAGAVIRNGSPDRRLRIGAGATVGMGAVVVRDVPEGVTVVGNPARIINRRALAAE